MKLTEKAREMRNAYERERYQKNKEKNKERQIAYWNKKAEEAERQERETQDENEQKPIKVY